jgi:hypothetical protein
MNASLILQSYGIIGAHRICFWDVSSDGVLFDAYLILEFLLGLIMTGISLTSVVLVGLIYSTWSVVETQTISDPSKLSKPVQDAAVAETETVVSSSSNQDPVAAVSTGQQSKSQPAAQLDGVEAKSADPVDAYKLFPPQFHQFLDMPINTYENGTAYQPNPAFSDDPGKGGASGSSKKQETRDRRVKQKNQQLEDEPIQDQHNSQEAPDYNYYDTGADSENTGSDHDKNHEDTEQQTNGYNPYTVYSQSSDHSKDQAYANYVASLTNNNQFGQGQGSYDPNYESDYESEYDGNYGTKVGSNPGKEKGYGKNSLREPSSPSFPAKKDKNDVRGKPASSSYDDHNDYSHETDGNKYANNKPFKPSQPLSTPIYVRGNRGRGSDLQDSKSKNSFDARPPYSKVEVQQNFEEDSYKRPFQAFNSNTRGKGSPGTISSNTFSPASTTGPATSEPSGPSSGGSGPSDDYQEEEGSAPAYGGKKESSKPLLKSPSSEGNSGRNPGQGRPKNSFKSGKNTGSSGPSLNAPVSGPSYESAFNNQRPIKTASQPLNSKYADGWMPISRPTAASPQAEDHEEAFGSLLSKGGGGRPYKPEGTAHGNQVNTEGSSGDESADEGGQGEEYQYEDEGPTSEGGNTADEAKPSGSESSASGPGDAPPPPPPKRPQPGPKANSGYPSLVKDERRKPEKFNKAVEKERKRPPISYDDNEESDYDSKDPSEPQAPIGRPAFNDNKRPGGTRGPGPAGNRPNNQQQRPQDKPWLNQNR